MKRGTVLLVALGGLHSVVFLCLVAAHPAASAAIAMGRSGASSFGHSSDYPAPLESAHILTRAADNHIDSLVEESNRAIIETGIS